MRAEEFLTWLSAIAGLSGEQRRQALQRLTKADGGLALREKALRLAKAASAGGGRTRLERRAGGKPGLSPLRWPRDRRLGPLERAVAVPLQELRAHVQWVDQNAHGAPAQEGALARSCPGDDRGPEPGEDRETLRRPSDHRLPLAPSVSPRARRRQTSNVERNCRGGSDLHSRILQRPLVRPAAQGSANGAEQPGIPALIRTTLPSSSPATGRGRPSMPFCRRTTAPRSRPR